MLNALFRHANEGIVVADKSGRIIMANPTAEEQFGYEKGELIGKVIEDLVPRDIVETHVHHRHHYFTNPHPRAMGKGINLFARRKDNSVFPVEISLSSFKTEEGEFAMGFIVDITYRKIHEQEITKAHDEIIQLNTELEKRVDDRTKELANAIRELARSKADVIKSLNKEKELNELKSRFVTTASHEFRTPLATILSSASLIAKYNEPEDEDKRRKHIERIKSSVSNLTEILNNFLSLGKLEEGIVRNSPETMKLDEFIRVFIDDNRSLLKPGQLVLYKHLKGKKEFNLDKHLLQNILLNLLSNAIKYSGNDTEIIITTSFSKDKLTLCVKDQGIGISKADQAHMFERFFRARNADHIQGTGLGLNIVKKYAELMNAEIRLESEIGIGSTFTLEINTEPSI